MNVELRPRVCSGHLVVALSGELDATDAITAAAAVTALAPAGQQLIIDLEALEFIDCCAVRALLGVRQAARQAGGDVLLAAPQGPVLRLLTLLHVPGVHASVASAAESVPAAAPALLPAGQRPTTRRTGGVPLSGAPYRMAGRLAVWCRRATVTRRAVPEPDRAGGHAGRRSG
jgi:anti-anti-sigma factor